MQFPGKALLISGFEQTGAQNTMDFDSTSNNLSCEGILCHIVSSSLCSLCPLW
jgi:hypothetical protein